MKSHAAEIPSRLRTLLRLGAREDYVDPELMESVGACRYSFGYKSRQPGNRFYTVMANRFWRCRRLPHYSNPRVKFLGSRTGVARSTPDSADAVRSINRIRGVLEAYRACKVDCQGN